MNHGVSLVWVDNNHIQEAIASNAHPDIITRLKANVAFGCVTGFEYHEVEFNDLGNLLSYDVGFSNFKFKEAASAIYNKEKHPNATGRIRGVNNIEGGCTWLWFDIDVTTISDTEMHLILANVNHHIGRTSDKNKQYKYRVIVELDREVFITREEWKFYLQEVANTLGMGKIDRLAMSQVIFGYKGREILSVTDGIKLNTDTELQLARAAVAKQEESYAMLDVEPGAAQAALQSPYSTFSFAYDAQEGDRWKTSMAAIEKAKRLGASREYITDLMYAINDFLDVPKSRDVVRTSLFSAI